MTAECMSDGTWNPDLYDLKCPKENGPSNHIHELQG